MRKLRIGVVSFTDPRAVSGIEKIDAANVASHDRLVKHLRGAGFDVVEPECGKLVRSRAGSADASKRFLSSGVDAMVFGCWKWTDPMLAVDVARRVSRPVCLAGDNDASSTPLGCMAAIGAAMLEIAPNSHCLNHHRVIGDFDAVAAWARGAGALSWMREQAVLLWGGSYCLKMAHLDDDASSLKSFIIGDVLVEDEYMLIRRAEKILSGSAERAGGFIKWLNKNGCEIRHDKKMATEDSIKRQAALYLAARDRLAELDGEGVAGVSVKCQPALSEEWGVTGCMIPAFLPFGEDSEEKRDTIATVCEGDIKGLLTSLMLQRFAGGTPAGFGDIRNISVRGRDLLVISNCGAASVYYAGMSDKASKCLKCVSIKGQCQGASGAAVGYVTPAFGKATIARLVRKAGEYTMQYALAESVAATRKMADGLGWGSMWPVSLFDVGLKLNRFAAAVASNHLSFIPGNYIDELSFFCREADIEMECLNG